MVKKLVPCVFFSTWCSLWKKKKTTWLSIYTDAIPGLLTWQVPALILCTQISSHMPSCTLPPSYILGISCTVHTLTYPGMHYNYLSKNIRSSCVWWKDVVRDSSVKENHPELMWKNYTHMQWCSSRRFKVPLTSTLLSLPPSEDVFKKVRYSQTNLNSCWRTVRTHPALMRFRGSMDLAYPVKM